MPVEPLAEPSAGTLFVFPFDHDTVPAAVAVREIAAALSAIPPRILLFLASIGRLRVARRGVTGAVIERSVAGRAGAGGARRVALSSGRGRRGEEWLVW